MKSYRKPVLLILFCSMALMSFAQYRVTGGNGTPLMAAEVTSERLQVYLVNGLGNAQISYTSTSTSHQWYRYSQRALEAEPVSSVQSGTTSIITGIESGYGYFVEESSAIYTQYIWIIDYSQYAFDIRSLSVSDNGNICKSLLLTGDIDVPRMSYQLPMSGRQEELQRQFEVSYNTLEWSEEQKAFTPLRATETITGNPFLKSIDAPLTDTPITLTGDLFARHFGIEKGMNTDEYTTVAIEVHADTTLIEQEVPNMTTSNPGLSAPATVLFTAYANEPVAALYQWTIYKNTDGGGADNPLVNFRGSELEYTFNEEGTYVAQLIVTDRSSECPDETVSFELRISDSYLMVPNAFSPGTTPGINDEFRVAYKSLVRFKAWIYNRWGVQLYHWTDPAQGWDGKYRGKYVPSGAYFYIIEAEGSDGVKYSEKGAVNILRPKAIDDEIIQ